MLGKGGNISFFMIGIFDSGVGGMTVARAVETLCPGFPLLYFGDIARAPYGPKSPQTIINYSIENTEFLLDRGAELIVIACNSAASSATEILRARYQVPIIEVVTPAIAKALAVSRNGRVGVIGTRATIKSGVYDKGIRAAADFKVVSQACPLLVPLVEEGWLNRREAKMIVRHYLHPLKAHQIDTLVLGCTHYPLLAHLIQPRIGRRVRLIDSGVETAHYLRDYLNDRPDLAARLCAPEQASGFFVSDITETAVKMSHRIFNRPIQLNRVQP